MNSPQLSDINTNKDIKGIIPKSVESFLQLKEQTNLFSIYISIFQIYNEKIYDLLQESNQTKGLKIIEDKSKNPIIGNISRKSVRNMYKF